MNRLFFSFLTSTSTQCCFLHWTHQPTLMLSSVRCCFLYFTHLRILMLFSIHHCFLLSIHLSTLTTVSMQSWFLHSTSGPWSWPTSTSVVAYKFAYRLLHSLDTQPVLLNHIAAFLCYHQCRCVYVTTYKRGHDGCVDNTQPSHSVDSEACIDDSTWVGFRSHFASTGWMESCGDVAMCEAGEIRGAFEGQVIAAFS